MVSPTATHGSVARFTSACLLIAALLFAAFPLLRPWGDKDGTSAGLIDAMASPLWVVAHCAGAFGFVALTLAAVGLRDLHRGTPGQRGARIGALVLAVGSGGTLLYYGAETFALHALAASPTDQTEALIAAVREGTTQLTLFGVGLLLVAAGATLLALAVQRGGVLPRWSAVPLAITVALYLPQFFTTPGLRVAHGIVLAASAVWMAVAVLRSGREARVSG